MDAAADISADLNVDTCINECFVVIVFLVLFIVLVRLAFVLCGLASISCAPRRLFNLYSQIPSDSDVGDERLAFFLRDIASASCGFLD